MNLINLRKHMKIELVVNEMSKTYNPSHKLLRQMRKMVLFRLATSNVKLILETIWSGWR